MTAVVLRGDARRLPLPDGCADLIVTSPPFWQLRSYTDNGAHYDGQIGSEPTPGEYIAALIDCTREWVRVLKPCGSLFVELGDKYSTSMHSYNYRDPGTYTRKTPQPDGEWSKTGWKGEPNVQPTTPLNPGAQPKSLLDLPHRYAIRCMDELGLILRAEIIWHHVNGLPESVTDRVRRAHSAVFHFTVQPRYYAAVDEIREPHDPDSWRPSKVGRTAAGVYRAAAMDRSGSTYAGPNPLGKLPGSVWDIPSQPLTVPPELGVDHFAAFPMELPRRVILGWSPPGICTACGEGRRPVSEGEYRQHRPSGGLASRIERGNKVHDGGAGHWGTFGTNLRRDVTITGYACACTPYTDHPGGPGSRPATHGRSTALGNGVRDNPGGGYGNADRTGPWREHHFDDWTPPPTLPAIVVDPFGGTGTTALVAAAYGRLGLSFDRSADYCRLAAWRTADPAERARALQVPKPPSVPDGQGSLFDLETSWPA